MGIEQTDKRCIVSLLRDEFLVLGKIGSWKHRGLEIEREVMLNPLPMSYFGPTRLYYLQLLVTFVCTLTRPYYLQLLVTFVCTLTWKCKWVHGYWYLWKQTLNSDVSVLKPWTFVTIFINSFETQIVWYSLDCQHSLIVNDFIFHI